MKNIASNKKRILFLNPKIIYRPWPVPDDFTRYFIRIPNVTYPLLAASLNSIPGIDICIKDFLFEDISKEKYKELIKSYDIFCMNAMADVVALNIEINIEIIKRINPFSIVILGGHHATFFAEDWIKRGADFVILNDGEKSFPELIKSIVNGVKEFSINGVISKYNYRSSTDKKILDISEDLDETPFPRFELLDFSCYNISRFSKGYTSSLETSRGCAHNCVFCTVPVYWQRRQRVKSLTRVLEEINYLYKLGVRQIAIIDDNFFALPERDYKVFEYILKNEMKDMIFGSFLRPDYVLMYPDLIKLASRAGLKKVFIGYESDDPYYIKKMGKQVNMNTVEKYADVYNILHNLGVYVYGFYLTGFPFQTELKPPKKKIADVLLYSDWKPRKFTGMSNKYGISESFYWMRFINEKKFDIKKSLTYFFSTLDFNFFNKIALDHLLCMIYGYYDTIKYWNFSAFKEFIKKIYGDRENIVNEIINDFKKRVIKGFGL